MLLFLVEIVVFRVIAVWVILPVAALGIDLVGLHLPFALANVIYNFSGPLDLLIRLVLINHIPSQNIVVVLMLYLHGILFDCWSVGHPIILNLAHSDSFRKVMTSQTAYKIVTDFGLPPKLEVPAPEDEVGQVGLLV